MMQAGEEKQPTLSPLQQLAESVDKVGTEMAVPFCQPVNSTTSVFTEAIADGGSDESSHSMSVAPVPSSAPAPPAEKPSSESKGVKTIRIPCRARGMPVGHNHRTAYFLIPIDVEHGAPLVCSYAGCRDRGVRFHYCLRCKEPIAKRNFRNRHRDHDLAEDQPLPEGANHGDGASAAARASPPVVSKEAILAATAAVFADSGGPAVASKKEGRSSGRHERDRKKDKKKKKKKEKSSHRSKRKHSVDSSPPSQLEEMSSGSTNTEDEFGGKSKRPRNDFVPGGYDERYDRPSRRNQQLQPPMDRAREERLPQFQLQPELQQRHIQQVTTSGSGTGTSTTTTTSSAETVHPERVEAWVDLFWNRPNTSDDDGMSKWLMNILEVSKDPRRPLKKRALEKESKTKKMSKEKRHRHYRDQSSSHRQADERRQLQADRRAMYQNSDLISMSSELEDDVSSSSSSSSLMSDSELSETSSSSSSSSGSDYKRHRRHDKKSLLQRRARETSK